MKILPKGIIEKCTRTVGDKNEIDKIMQPTLILQWIVGKQILDPKWTWKQTLPRQLMVITLSIYVVFGTIEIIDNTNEAKVIAEAAFTFIVITTTRIRFYLFLIAREHFKFLYLELKTTLIDYIKHDSEEKAKLFLRNTKILVNSILLIFNTPIVIYTVNALWNYMTGTMVTLSKTTSTLMPMKTPYFQIGLILHAIFMGEILITSVTINVWFVTMMLFFCTASDSTVKILRVHKIQDESASEYATRLNNRLRMFYKCHVHETGFLNRLNAMFKWLSIVPLITVALSFCNILLVMSKGIDIKFVTTAIPVSIELAVYNWFGEQIKNKAQNWKTALLEFDWVNLRTKDKKSYYIIVSYMIKEFGLKTANGTELSMLTMSATVKFSYQTFTVLQSMEA